MPIKRLHTEARYSEVVINRNTVYLSGQLADDFSGDIGQQTGEALASVDRLLAEAGTDKSQVLSALIHLRELADYAGMNEVWDRWLVPGCAPARTTVQALMYAPEVRVEITIVAALPDSPAPSR